MPEAGSRGFACLFATWGATFAAARCSNNAGTGQLAAGAGGTSGSASGLSAGSSSLVGSAGTGGVSGALGAPSGGSAESAGAPAAVTAATLSALTASVGALIPNLTELLAATDTAPTRLDFHPFSPLTSKAVGEAFRVRIYPYSTAAATKRYLSLQSVSMHGVAH